MYQINITDQDGEPVACDSSTSILDAIRAKGYRIPYACKGGGCGLCKIQVVDGDYERGPSSKAVLPDKERELNYSLACKTYPKGDIKVCINISK